MHKQLLHMISAGKCDNDNCLASNSEAQNGVELVYVPDSFPTLSETFVLAEMRAMLERGHRVQVAPMHRGDCFEMLDWKPWRAIRDKAELRAPSGRCPRPSIAALCRAGQVKQGYRPGAWMRRWRSAASVEELVERIGQCRPELMVVHFCYDNAVAAEIASARLGCAYTLFLHGSDIYTVPHRRIRKICAGAAAVVTTSAYMEKQIRALGITGPIERSPLGIDLAAFKFVERNHSDHPPRIVYVGRLGHNKNPLRTLRVFSRIRRRIPEAELFLVGSGPLEAECRSFVKERQLEGAVRMLGSIHADDLQGILALANLFVLLSDAEGLGVVFMEAQATGLPCIGSRVGGVPEVIVEGETGFTVDISAINAEQQAADVISELLGNPARLQQMGRNARQHAEAHFDHTAHADRMHGIFTRIAGQR